MSFKKYIISMAISTFIAILGLIFVILKIDPTTTGTLGYLLFYVTLFFSSVGLLSLLMFVFEWIFNKNAPIFSIMAKSFRHGILLSVLLIIFLILEQFNVFTWWSMTLVVAAILVIEFFFVSHKPGRKF